MSKSTDSSNPFDSTQTAADTPHKLAASTVQLNRLLRRHIRASETTGSLIDELVAEFTRVKWWRVANGQLLFSSEHGSLWQEYPKQRGRDSMREARRAVKALNIAGLQGCWKLPSEKQADAVRRDRTFPLGQAVETKGAEHWKTMTWLLEHGLTRGTKIVPSDSFLAVAVHKERFTAARALRLFAANGFDLQPASGLNGLNGQGFAEKYQRLQRVEGLNGVPGRLPHSVLKAMYAEIDYSSIRLPRLDDLRFTDPSQGLWEFYAPQPLPAHYMAISTDQRLRARDPAKDVKQASVAIDFGTSSTVVAIRSDGRDELLRVGMQAKDYSSSAIKASHFENPTVLEMLDFASFMQAWQSEACRPLVSWDDVHVAHEARSSFRNNNSNAKVVGSILLRLKQWAMHGADMDRTLVTDQVGYEYEIPYLQSNNPVKGKAVEVGNDYPFDPVELYAWYLGMYINWRSRGIFLRYYMTFPVDFKKEVKANILSSFRRGLSRSLPYALTQNHCFADFSVVDQASEPAAFAAAAIRRLELEPTELGVAYAVFDFGGGTTDFDYGIYRLPREEGTDEGDYDAVIEHFGASGDNFLGGEVILENLAYLVFRQNREVCGKNGIAFTKPMDAAAFPGSEMLITTTQAALTNTTLMMTTLRGLWEKGGMDASAEGAEKFRLINRDGEIVDVDMVVRQTELVAFIEERILGGLKSFFFELKKAFLKYDIPDEIPEKIHLFLAGNSSRSIVLHEFLGISANNRPVKESADARKPLGQLSDEDLKRALAEREKQIVKKAEGSNHTAVDRANARHDMLMGFLEDVFPQKQPDFTIHLPFEADGDDVSSAITAKTGVALGLLDLCPGEPLKVINHATEENTEDSPFQFFVGMHRLNRLKVCLERSEPYNQWKELGPVRAGRAILVYTSNPEARSGALQRGDQSLKERELAFEGDMTGCRAFVRVVAPDAVEVCAAQSAEAAQQQQHTNLKRIVLD